MEMGVATLIMLLSSMLWGNFIATYCGVIASQDPEGQDFRRTMDELNRFISAKRLDKAMQLRLREYFHQTRHLQVADAHRHLMNLMSPKLQGEVAWSISEKWLTRVWFLRTAGKPFMVQLSRAAEAAKAGML